MSSKKNTTLKVALVGNPNAGKSTVFNSLTGLNQKTGNYSGVTVDRYEGFTSTVYKNIKYQFSIIDLPGIYSLYPKSGDEEIACKTLLDEKEHIDVIVIVADSTNLKRNLLLASQLIDLKFKTVLAFNMIDEAIKQNILIDAKGFEMALGVDVVMLNSRKQQGFETLKEAIIKSRASTSIFYDLAAKPLGLFTSYREFIKAGLNKDAKVFDYENQDKLYRYQLITYLVKRYVKSPEQLSQKKLSAAIDSIATHRVFGYLILLLVLFLVFQFIFFISETPMNWIEHSFLSLGNAIEQHMAPGQLNNLLTHGILAGISGVLMFIPQIAFLFMFIGLLEDSGYMARASFIMDRIMRPFGLNGRSVIPLISGTACAVPSIMATRSISNAKERLITIFILPLISCSARLPVYTLLISVMYPNTRFLGVFNSRGLVLFLLYLLGFVVSLLTAFVLKRSIRSKEISYFIMELPVYRRPQLKSIGIMVFQKIKVFVKEAGKIILAISILLWFLSSHGGGDEYRALEKTQLELSESKQTNDVTNQLNRIQTLKLEKSYIGQLGHSIEPLIQPLGFDWKIGIALLTSFAAREVFVGTMATIYQSGENKNEEGIKQKILNEKNKDGTLKYNSAVCWSLLLFYAFALQCMSTVAIVKRETKSWKWVMIQLFFMSALAYCSSFIAYRFLA